MKLNFNHFFRLIDETAIIEHATGSVPNKAEGYSLDDVARAIMVCLRFWTEESKMAIVLPRLYKYVEMTASEGGFLNDLEADGNWKQIELSKGEHFGRVMVTLAELGWGEVVLEPYRTKARRLFSKYQQLTLESSHVRVWAQMTIAWTYRLLVEKEELKDEDEAFVETLAERLVGLYRIQEKEGWNWFEEVVSYDNGRLPMALLAAYRVIPKKEYLKVARSSLDFLTNKLYDPKLGYFIFPGNKGWWRKGGNNNIYDQQPVEAGSMVEAYSKAYGETGDEVYATLAKRAWEWYFGRNIRGESLVDENGGVADGFSSEGVSLNQGAEAVLSFLVASDALRETGLWDNKL